MGYTGLVKTEIPKKLVTEIPLKQSFCEKTRPMDTCFFLLPSLKLTFSFYKRMVGLRFSYWDPAYFQGAFAVSFMEGKFFMSIHN